MSPGNLLEIIPADLLDTLDTDLFCLLSFVIFHASSKYIPVAAAPDSVVAVCNCITPCIGYMHSIAIQGLALDY